jgi:hypothetical protein
MPRFPLYYQPRPYQAELHTMWRNNRIGVAVFPRQSGKDVAMSMEMCERRLRIPKSTGTYISLDNPMIKDILWQKTYIDPETKEYVRMLQDNVHPDFADWKNTVMEGEFTNGSRLKVQGYFQSGRDKNGVGTSFLDYAFTELALFTREDPIPRLMPIIQGEHEDKKLMVASTPRGKRQNPLWQLIQNHSGQKDFQVITRTIDDLNAMMRKSGLPPVMTPEKLDEVRETYLRRRRYSSSSTRSATPSSTWTAATLCTLPSTSARPACTLTPRPGSRSSGSTTSSSCTTAARATARPCRSTWTTCSRSRGSTSWP